MFQRSCDLCQNAAVIHDTVSRSGVVKVRHLCRVHGLKVWRDALPSADLLSGGKAKKPVLHSQAAWLGKMMQQRGEAHPPQ